MILFDRRDSTPFEVEKKIKDHIEDMITLLNSCSDRKFSEEFVTNEKLKTNPVAYTNKVKKQVLSLEKLFLEDVQVNKRARSMLLSAIKDATTTLKTEM
ncbi:hypothetical protein K9M79_08240 [Candidatus Woesearchaeota archaeon]|nr:hypothetical protein [Candidatus Woesearchaeota archaeon]